jgi:acyl-CoA synthetase (AMP-forming)/AMP-acid ligase II
MIDLDGIRHLADVPRRQARLMPHATASICDGRVTTFAELDRRASQVARQLIAAGVSPGDRIAVLGKNTDCFFEILYGAAKARATLAPINFRLAPPEIAYILADCEAEIVFVGQEFLDLAGKAVAAMAKKPAIVALDGPTPGLAHYAAWRDEGLPQDPYLVADAQDEVLQLYTSGTTGHPKGVMLSNANYLAFLDLAGRVEGFRYGAGESVMNAMPQFHVAGANVGIIAHASGASAVVVRDLVPAAVLDLIARHRIAHTFFVPAVILMLMAAPEMATADLTSLHTVAYGASPIAEDLLVRAQARFGCRFLQLYGMTETTGAGTVLPPEAHDPALGKLRACGQPWPGIEVRVVDAEGRDVADGAVGEIVIRSGVVMKGYWKNPKATAETIRNGWLHTGDAAYRDGDGYIFIYDRVKDMIVTGGENVYPAEVENAIFGAPGVADVAVIGVPDDQWGETVKAIVVAKPDAEKNPEAIIAWARERIAGYKAPKSVDFVDAIPRNASGKILRRELRKPYWEGRTRMVS